MKTVALAILLLNVVSAVAQTDTVVSKVYRWDNLKITKDNNREVRQIAEGSGTALSYMKWHATTVDAGKAPHAPHKHDEEELIIIKEGQLQVTVKDSSKTLGPGSVALFVPGDEHGLLNTGNTKASYYVLRYKSKAPADIVRSKNAGGSFTINFNDVVFKPNDKGGRRNYMNRATAMIKRLEMHVTTLNPGMKSHDPHTHAAEEIILMIKGNGVEQIADSRQPASTGDLIYLSSNIPHAIENTGTEPCMYFAFQWE